MKDIPAIRGRNYIASLIAEGEHDTQDFKFLISDARKIARSISAFANHKGGRLLIGVKDNGVAAGVRNEEDIYMVEAAGHIYCSPSVEVSFMAYKVDPGVIVVKAEIAPSATPVSVKEDDGTLKAYIRVKDENIAAPPEWLAARSGEPTGIDGHLLRYSRHEELLLNMIAEQGRVSLRQFITESRLPTSAATAIAGSMIATGVISLSFSNRQWVMTAPA